MAKIKLKTGATIEETFQDFIISRRAKGLKEKTIESYQHHFHAVARHLDVEMDMQRLLCLRRGKGAHDYLFFPAAAGGVAGLKGFSKNFVKNLCTLLTGKSIRTKINLCKIRKLYTA